MTTEVAIKICGVSFESLFKQARLFPDARCGDMAKKCLETFASYGLGPAQITVRNGDQAFNYDLTVSLFNGNGTLKISAEKFEISFQNATSGKDLEIVQDCVARAYELAPLPEINTTLISANAHATLSSNDEAQHFLQKYAQPQNGIVSGGTIAYIRCENWEQEIRLVLDRSLAFPTGLFMSWSTTVGGGGLSRDRLKSLETALEESLKQLGIVFEKQS